MCSCGRAAWPCRAPMGDRAAWQWCRDMCPKHPMSLSPSLSPALAHSAAVLPMLGEEPPCLVPLLHL